MENIIAKNKSECCGCTACVSVCPVFAITMKNDREGFCYPSVDETICVHCGLCLKTCSFISKQPITSNITSAYVAKHRDLTVRMNSRSGGVFVAVSDWILQMKGVIYGCILDDNLDVVHIRADNKKTRDLMCKSKYVQSNMDGVIPQIAKDLINNRYVLYSGTGCQVEGVLSALKVKNINCTKLYTIDLVCHGVPSPLIFKEYIRWVQMKYKGKITSFDFRDKQERGWDSHIESYIINGRKYSGNTWRDLFYSNLCLRPACYNCKYCTVGRNSDLTIADAWGIKSALPSFYDKSGVSMLLVQSEKGQRLLETVIDACEIAELPLEKMMQYNLKNPTKPKGNRTAFWKVYYKYGFSALIRYNRVFSYWYKLKSRIKHQLCRAK